MPVGALARPSTQADSIRGGVFSARPARGQAVAMLAKSYYDVTSPHGEYPSMYTRYPDKEHATSQILSAVVPLTSLRRWPKQTKKETSASISRRIVEFVTMTPYEPANGIITGHSKFESNQKLTKP